MLLMRRLNYVDASGIVTLNKLLSGAQVEIALFRECGECGDKAYQLRSNERGEISRNLYIICYGKLTKFPKFFVPWYLISCRT